MPHLAEVGAPAWGERGSYSKWTVALNQAFGTAINRNKINSPFFSACVSLTRAANQGNPAL